MNDDYTQRYNTTLTPAEEKQFEAWAQQQNRLGDLYDYDLRGAWKASAQEAANGHLPDTYKKPNHPTFSRESMYSTPEMPGGEWLDAGGGKWAFHAAPTNVQNMTLEGLQQYFRDAEPDATLVLPSGPEWHRPTHR